MKHISEKGYNNILKLLDESIDYIEKNDLTLAKIRVVNAKRILKANKDTKPPKPKKVWDDEFW